MKEYLENLPALKTKDLLVVAATPHYFGAKFVSDFSLPSSWPIKLNCRFSNDLSLADEADALWFHVPSMRFLPIKKPGQKWIMMTMESDANYPVQAFPEFVEKFDLFMTYKPNSDIPCLYASQRDNDFWCNKQPVQTQTQVGLASTVYIASNPIAHRDEYVKELMQHMKIDAIGGCLRNVSRDGFLDQRAAWGAGSGISSVVQATRDYKFNLAFENSIADDYVTERVYVGLSAGSLPIYRGASNVADFLPSKDAIINTDNFQNPKQLAEFIDYLDHNDDEYLKYFSWRNQSLDKRRANLISVADIPPKFRMAVKLAHDCDAECRCGGSIRN